MSAYGHLLRERAWVSILRGIVLDPMGNPTEDWSDPTPIRCRTEGGNELVLGPTGEQVVSTVRVMTDAVLPHVPADLKVWLPGEDPETDYGHKPKQVTSAATLDGRARLVEVAL